MHARKILISPLNWGFGHAGRMLALAQALMGMGHEVTFGVDSSLMPLIENELPGTAVISIPGVHIKYSRRLPQYLCIFLQLPRIIAASLREHRILRQIVASIEPDIIISDNRPGLFHRKFFSVYVTHQLRIAFPRYLRFLEPLGVWLHRLVIRNFDLCLIPDYPGPENLSGKLSHELTLPRNVRYMGPLSRFCHTGPLSRFRGAVPVSDGHPGPLSRFRHTDPLSRFRGSVKATGGAPGGDRPYCCLILSGPEPQRSLLMEKVAAAVDEMPLVVLAVTPLAPGCTVVPAATVTCNHDTAISKNLVSGTGVTVFVNPDTAAMMSLIAGSALVITRSGYTSIMELASMGRGAVLIPTPGQTEQEYLGSHLNGRHGFVTVRQHDIGHSGIVSLETISDSNALLPDSGPLLEEALNLLLQ